MIRGYRRAVAGLFLIGGSALVVGTVLQHPAGVARTYYIAADEVEWDYAPSGRDEMMRHALDTVEMVAWDLLFLPARGATPFVSAIVQLSPLPEHSRFYMNVGGGLITGHNPNGDRLNGWLEATAAWRSPLHDITPFVQVGHATGSGHDFELLIALAHPLSPYHMPRHS